MFFPIQEKKEEKTGQIVDECEVLVEAAYEVGMTRVRDKIYDKKLFEEPSFVPSLSSFVLPFFIRGRENKQVKKREEERHLFACLISDDQHLSGRSSLCYVPSVLGSFFSFLC